MTKLKLLAAVALCMAYIAGIATGWAGYTLAGEQAPPQEPKGSWLSHTLQLTEEQKARMEAIWSREANGRDGEDGRSKMRALYEERNDRVAALLTEEQRRAFDAIYLDFEERKDDLSRERRERHEKAVEETMAILTPEQQKSYQKILDDFERRGPQRNHGGPWPPPEKK